jgi:hypothetical protein
MSVRQLSICAPDAAVKRQFLTLLSENEARHWTAQAPNSSLPAVFKKYSQPKFHEVAKMPGPCAV